MPLCPDDSALRTWLDQAAPPRQQQQLAAHVPTCAACQARLARLADDATRSALLLGALTTVPTATDTDAAWARLRTEIARRTQTAPTRERSTSMFALLFRGLAARTAAGTLASLAVILTLILTPLGSEAAKALNVFRVTTFRAITIEVDAASLPRPSGEHRDAAKHQADATWEERRQALDKALASFGLSLTTSITDKTAGAVADVATAKAAAPAGTSILTIGTLPSSLTQATLHVFVADASRSVLTADVKKLREALRARAKDYPRTSTPGADLTSLPGVDPHATSLSATLQTSFTTMQVWGDANKGLALAQGPSPVLTLSEGIDIVALRDALVASPLIGKTTREQILSIRDDEWSTTLFIPVPTGSTIKNVSVGGVFGVGGAPALLIISPDGKEAALFWRHNETLYALAGTVTESEILAAAASLR